MRPLPLRAERHIHSQKRLVEDQECLCALRGQMSGPARAHSGLMSGSNDRVYFLMSFVFSAALFSWGRTFCGSASVRLLFSGGQILRDGQSYRNGHGSLCRYPGQENGQPPGPPRNHS